MSKQDDLKWENAWKNGTMQDLFNWDLPAITLDGCLDVIRDLANTGDRPNNMLLACWAGITSVNTKLEYNGNATRALARLLDAPALPDYESLKAYFKQSGTKFGCMPKVYEAMVTLHRMAQAGELPSMPSDTWTQAQWETWRDAMVALPQVSWKVASFIGLLLCPLTCPLVPVDRWVMRRMNEGPGAVPQARGRYMEVEARVRAERDAAGHNNLPLGCWHWYKWSQARQAAGPNIEPASVRPESHNNLSPRWY